MSLKSGKANIGKNIDVEKRSGKPLKQAIAIALSKAGKAGGDGGGMKGKKSVEGKAHSSGGHSSGYTQEEVERCQRECKGLEEVRAGR